MSAYQFKFPTGKGYEIESLVIRETDGKDEEKAAAAKEAKGATASMTEELLRLSITHVDGEAVEQPFGGMDKWKSKTRGAVLSAFRKINTFEGPEAADFLATGEPYAG